MITVKNLFSYSILIFCFFTLASCSKKEEINKSKITETHFFFSLDSFANIEFERHLQYNTKVNKTISLDNKTEKHDFNFDSLGWKKELMPLKKNDINKTAWVDKFKTIENENSDNSKTIIYINTAKEIPVKKIQIDFDSLKQVKQIIINSTSDNLLFNSEQTYTYKPKDGYSLVSDQKAIFLSKHNLEVIGQFLNSKP